MFQDTEFAPDVKSDERQPRESGWFLLSRCFWNHPVVGARAGGPRPSKDYPQPLDYGWAWLWLLREGSFKDRQKTVNGRAYPLAVGELVASIGFMSNAWGWSPKAVRKFIEKLGAHGMLKWGTQKGRETRTLTICNYPKYQFWLQDQGHSQGHKEARKGATTRNKDSKQLLKTPPTPSRGDEPVLDCVAEADLLNEPKVGHDRLTKTGDAAARSASEVKIAFDLWNATAKKYGLQTSTRLSAAKAAKIRARLAEDGLEGWNKALAEVSRSKLLRGKVKPKDGSKRPWAATLDFLLQASSFDKVLDGTYTRFPGDVISDAVPVQGSKTASQQEADILAELRQQRGVVSKVNSPLT